MFKKRSVASGAHGENCDDCKGPNESYMVRDAVWKQARLKEYSISCVPCLEKRLRRELTLKDFKRVEINNPSFGSKGHVLLRRLRGWDVLPKNYIPTAEDML